MHLQPATVFSVFGQPVTTTVVTTWAMIAVLALLAVLARRHIHDRPSRWQAMAEWGVRSLQAMLDELVGADSSTYLPLVATLASFVLVANLMGALPSIDAPTSDINTTAALAIIVFFSVHYAGIRQFGLWGYLKKFSQPTPILLPINLLSHLTRTFSMAIRLFGNIMSHQIIVSIVLVIVPLVIPAVLQIFGLFIGVLQAYIFTLLTMVYIGGAARADGEF